MLDLLITAALAYLCAGALVFTFIVHPREAERLSLVCECDGIVALLMVADAIVLWPREFEKALRGIFG